MIGAFRLGVSHSPPHRVRLKLHVSIGKQQPLAPRLIRSRPHGMRLAEPARRQVTMMNHPQATMRGGTSRNHFHNLARAVSRPIVHRDQFIIVIIEFKQASKRLLDIPFLIPRRNNNRNQRIAGSEICKSSNRIAVPFGRGDVGYAGHADRGFNDARKPGQRQNRACNPVKVMHPCLGLPCLKSCAVEPNRRSEFHTVKQYGR